MVTSSKRAYAIPRSTAPRAPALQQSTADLYLRRRHSNKVLAQSLWGLWVLVHTRFIWALQASLAGIGFDSKCYFTLLPSCWGFSFALGHEASFLCGIQHSSVDGCSAVSWNFGVLAKDEQKSFYSVTNYFYSTTNWKIHKEMGIPDHLTCFLRNLYAGQEATVRIGHGTTDWFQIRKGVHQGCILSPCLLTYTHSTSWEILGWMKHKLESRLPGEISIASDMQMTPPLWQKVKKN